MDERVRVLYHREADGWWTESPDVEGWSAAGDSYAEAGKLAEEGIPFALEHPTELEHHVPTIGHILLDPASIDQRAQGTPPVPNRAAKV